MDFTSLYCMLRQCLKIMQVFKERPLQHISQCITVELRHPARMLNTTAVRVPGVLDTISTIFVGPANLGAGMTILTLDDLLS